MDKDFVYMVDANSGVCNKVSTESIRVPKFNIPIDVVLKLNAKDYTILTDNVSSSLLRTKSINNKKPVWVYKLLAISKKNKKFLPDDDITVQVTIEDTGNNTMRVDCLIEPNMGCIKIFSGVNEDFFNNKVSSEWKWLPFYVQNILKSYDWLNIACIDLLLAVDPLKYDPSKCKLLRGITTEKGLFGNAGDRYCADGEYAISEIVCFKDCKNSLQKMYDFINNK